MDGGGVGLGNYGEGGKREGEIEKNYIYPGGGFCCLCIPAPPLNSKDVRGE